MYGPEGHPYWDLPKGWTFIPGGREPYRLHHSVGVKRAIIWYSFPAIMLLVSFTKAGLFGSLTVSKLIGTALLIFSVGLVVAGWVRYRTAGRDPLAPEDWD